MPMTLRACSLLAVLLAAASSRSAQREAVSTRAALDYTPFIGPRTDRAELNPVLAGDLVLATTTLRVFAFDACSTDLNWSAGPPNGWDELDSDARAELFEGLGTRLWVEPAVGESVVIAALQIPISRRKNEEWQGFSVLTALPERRLFAFELRTGRPLWNHSPPSDWDGASGPPSQRMSLINSPTIVGQYVVAASWSDESSVDYHVSCYQLATGALVWSTFVVRGQMERNMYGQAPWEFSAAPLVAVPERGLVLAQTGLGLVVALNIATGEILWRTEYQAIELPKTRSYRPPKRETVWRMSPPIVVGDVVLATPPDSRELLALDLADGRLLWRVSNSTLSKLARGRQIPDIDHLIGTDENVVYLGGTWPCEPDTFDGLAVTKPGGLRSSQAFQHQWSVLQDLASCTARGQLWGDGLYIPRPDGCTELDRRSGQSTCSHDMKGTPRGILVTDDAIYALADDGLFRIER